MPLSSPASAPSVRPLRLAITLGDPAGIGPEIILRMFQDGGFPPATIPFVVGEARHLEQVGGLIGSSLSPKILDLPPSVPSPAGTIPVIEPSDFHFSGGLVLGRVAAECGAAAWAYIRKAVELVRSGQADAIVTAPLHKEALQAAGCPHPGHTELLADLAGGMPVAMLLVGGGLRVALATIHEPFVRVRELLTVEGILGHLRIMDRFIPWFGLEPETARETGGKRPSAPEKGNKLQASGENDAKAAAASVAGHPPRRPRIGVTGLNPHAGEGGLFGNEEREIIDPAIRRACAEGINAAGPLPADTIFHFHREGAYDAVLAMYHDQALIPVKTLDFHGGVNVTMGLPFIRTSVDHGTAFDIAGRGLARPDSLHSALEMAALLARNRKRMEKGE